MKVKEIKKELFLYNTNQRISFQEALDYEIHSHWLTFWIWGFYWGQNAVIRYAIWKVKRKYKRYKWARTFTIW